MPAKLSEGLRARHAQSLATHGSRLTDGLGRHQVGMLQASGLRAGLIAPLTDPTLQVFTPGDLRQYHTRASVAMAFGADGVLRQFASGELRIVPSPVGLLAALREPAATNLIQWSSQQEKWVFGGAQLATVSADVAIAPDGTQTADLVTRAAGGNTYVASGTGGAAGAYSFSQYVRAGTFGTRVGMRIQGSYPNRGDALFDLVAGTVVGVNNGGTASATSARIEQTPFPGWWRCYLSTTLADAAAQMLWAPCDATIVSVGGWEGAGGVNPADVYAWGAQGEAGPFSTSLIPTAGAQASRARDEISLPISVGLGQPVTLLLDAVTPYTNGAVSVLVRQVGGGEYISVQSGRQVSTWNGAVQITTTNQLALGSRGRMAHASDSLGRSIALNGTLTSDANLAGVGAALLIGQNAIGSDTAAHPLYIHEFRAWRRRVPNEQLRLLTQ